MPAVSHPIEMATLPKAGRVTHGVPLSLSVYSSNALLDFLDNCRGCRGDGHAKISAHAKITIAGLPTHDEVGFDIDGQTLMVKATLFRLPTPQEYSDCLTKEHDPLCQLELSKPVAWSSGVCEIIVRPEVGARRHLRSQSVGSL